MRDSATSSVDSGAVSAIVADVRGSPLPDDAARRCADQARPRLVWRRLPDPPVGRPQAPAPADTAPGRPDMDGGSGATSLSVPGAGMADRGMTDGEQTTTTPAGAIPAQRAAS